MPIHVIIHGGGLSGALAAIYLLQFTGHVTVIEKRSDLRKSTAETGRSINLILTSRGLFALREVGLEAAALKLCVPVEGRVMHSSSGGSSAGGVFQPYGVSKHEVNYSISRTQLNAMLIEEAEQRGARFATYKGRSGSVSMKCDVFFGADGVGSPTRTMMLNKLQSEGVVATERMERLGISYKEVTFPSVATSSSGGGYSMDPRGLHIWPRGAHFLMALADKNGTFTGTLYLPDGSAPLPVVPDASVPTFQSLGTDIAATEAYIKQFYPDVPSLVPNVVEQLTQRPHGLLATLRTTHWHYRGKVCLFGDSAHGVVPFFGQGMNCAFESITILYRYLCQLGLGRETTEAVFRMYESQHKASGVAIADMAIENFAEMSYKVSLPEFLRAKAIENAVEATYPTLLRSRYWMVTKSLIPYALVKAAGVHVDRCVAEIAKAIEEAIQKEAAAGRGGALNFLGAVPEQVVRDAIAKHVTPFFLEHGIDIGNASKEYYPQKKVTSHM
eukprot:CAMPEP_0176408750 /NCGR_PEP_ID=MMETSP0127-20121128/2127_1 /TAXON_ID=938130 /ORGANISM="Platyophrya macrostoma, Strain WH" /LENGTH=499 /DNA_ID=CAMNT_0017788075 /DNA_START=109 /DNA_END=1608 /DNA_ORIENTATION=+